MKQNNRNVNTEPKNQKKKKRKIEKKSFESQQYEQQVEHTWWFRELANDNIDNAAACDYRDIKVTGFSHAIQALSLAIRTYAPHTDSYLYLTLLRCYDELFNLEVLEERRTAFANQMIEIKDLIDFDQVKDDFELFDCYGYLIKAYKAINEPEKALNEAKKICKLFPTEEALTTAAEQRDEPFDEDILEQYISENNKVASYVESQKNRDTNNNNNNNSNNNNNETPPQNAVDNPSKLEKAKAFRSLANDNMACAEESPYPDVKVTGFNNAIDTFFLAINAYSPKTDAYLYLSLLRCYDELFNLEENVEKKNELASTMIGLKNLINFKQRIDAFDLFDCYGYFFKAYKAINEPEKAYNEALQICKQFAKLNKKAKNFNLYEADYEEAAQYVAEFEKNRNIENQNDNQSVYESDDDYATNDEGLDSEDHPESLTNNNSNNIQSAHRLFKQTVAAKVNEADNLYDEGQFKEAYILYQSAIRLLQTSVDNIASLRKYFSISNKILITLNELIVIPGGFDEMKKKADEIHDFINDLTIAFGIKKIPGELESDIEGTKCLITRVMTHAENLNAPLLICPNDNF